MLKRWYGLEIDLSVEGRFWKHLFGTLDFGLLIPGRAYDINVQLIEPTALVESISPDRANIAWMGRFTLFVDF